MSTQAAFVWCVAIVCGTILLLALVSTAPDRRHGRRGSLSEIMQDDLRDD